MKIIEFVKEGQFMDIVVEYANIKYIGQSTKKGEIKNE